MAETDGYPSRSNISAEEDAASLEAGVAVERPLLPETSPVAVYDTQNRQAYSARRALLLSIFSIILILLIGGAGLALSKFRSETTPSPQGSVNNQSITPPSLASSGQQLQLGQVSSLTINGQLQLADSVVFEPTSRPAQPVEGEFYLDQQTKHLYYYDGKHFLELLDGSQAVTSVGGLKGAITLGTGLQVSGGKLEATPTTTTLPPPSVTSVQGQTGAVSLAAGSGIGISGTTISNSGVLSLGGSTGTISVGRGLAVNGHTLSSTVSITSGSPTLNVSSDGNGNYVLTESGSGGILGSGTTNTIAMFTSAGTIGNSALSQSGSTVSVAGTLAATNLQGNGAGVTNVNAVTLQGFAANYFTNASDLSTGTLADVRLSASVTLQGNTFNLANDLVQLNATGGLPTLNGSLLTNLNAGSISAGTLADARLSSNIPLLNAAINNFTGASLEHNGNAVCDASNNCGYLTNGSASGSYVQLQSSTPGTAQAGNFNIDGTGIANELDATTINQNGHDVCDTSGNCPTGGNVSTSGTPTNGAIAMFTSGTTISNSILSQSGSTITVAGTLSATDLQGDGAGVTNVDAVTLQGNGANFFTNASNIASGTLADGRLSNNVTLKGNTFNGALELVQLNATAGLPALDGSLLTNLNATNLTTGTLADARLSTNVAFYNAVTANFTGALQQGGNDVCTTAGNCAGAGSGGGVTDGGSTNYLTKTDAGGNLTDSLLYDDGTNIGLGTTTPGALLDVQGGSGIVGQFSGRVVGADAVNPNEFVTLAQLNSAVGGVGGGVSSLNSLSGSLTLQGTTGQVTVTDNGSDTITMALDPSVTLLGQTVELGTETTGNYQTFTTAGDGVTVSGSAGVGTSPTVAVDNTVARRNANNNFTGTTLQHNGNDVCDTSGNCAGAGGGVTTSGGTANTIALFTGSGTIGDSILTQNVAGDTLTVAGTLSATNLQGDGSGVTNVDAITLQGHAASYFTDASNIASGTLANARLSASVTLQGNQFNQANDLVQLNGTAGLPALDGSLLTNLNATNLTTGTLDDARLSTDVALYDNVTSNFTGALQHNGNDVCDTSGNCPAGGNVSTSGTPTTNTIALFTSAGTIGNSIITQSGSTITVAGTLSATALQGNGAGITGLNATNIATGTLDDARLSTNVALLNADSNFTGTTLQHNGNDICDNSGNCAGAGGGVTTIGGTDHQIAMFTGTQAIGDSILSQNSSNDTITVTGTLSATDLQGDGSGITNLNATNLTTGTLADARLSTNVALYNATTANFTGNLQHNGHDVCDTSGNCTGVATTLHSAYTNGGNAADETINLNATNGGVVIQDNSTPIGGNLFAIQDSTGTTSYLAVTTSGATVAGTLTATDLQGDGSGITNVDAATLQGHAASYFTNATNLTTGTLNDSRLSANVTLKGNTFNGNNELVQLNATAGLPALDGSLLTNLNASNIATGTLNDGRLSTNVALLNANNNFTGTTLQHNGNDVCDTSGNCPTGGNVSTNGTPTSGTIAMFTSGSNIGNSIITQNGVGDTITVAGTLSATDLQGDGSGITNLNASNIASGTLNDSRLSANVTLKGNTFNGNNELVQLNATAGLPALDGSLLTNLNATNLTTGTLADARLSTNVALLNGTNNFTNTLQHNGHDVCDTSGNCAGASATLHTAYSNGASAADETINLTSGNGGVVIKDNSTPIGGNLFAVQNSTGSASYLAVTTSGVTVAGTLSATDLQGDGSGITNLNATNLTTGTLADARLSTNVAFYNAVTANFTGALQQGGNDVCTTAGNCAGAGSGGGVTDGGSTNYLTKTDAGGNLTDSLLYDDGTNIGLGTTTPGYNLDISGTANATNLYQNGHAVCDTTGNCAGAGGGVTTTGGTDHTIAMFTGSGTINDSIISQNGTNDTITVAGTLSAAALQGDGAGLTNVDALTLQGNGASYFTNATNLTTGTLADARLSTNVALYNATTANFTGNLQHNGHDVCDTSGNCTGVATTLHSAYTNGGNAADETINLNATNGGVVIQDNSTPIGGNLFAIQDSTGTTSYLAVTTSGATVAGTLTATDLQGDGSGITNVDAATLQGHAASYFTNATNLTTGTLNDSRLSANVTLKGNTFNGNNELVQLNATAGLPALDGSLLTNLNASNIATGTLNDGRLSTNVALLNANNNFTGTTLQHNGNDVCDTSGNCAGAGGGVTTSGGTANTIALFTGSGTIGDSILTQNVAGDTLTVAGTLSATNLQGDGSGVTNINAANVTSGTLNDARLSNNVTLKGNTFNGASQLVLLNGTAGLPALDGSLLTNLNATNLTTGTLNDSRLSAAVTLQGNSFNAAGKLVQLNASSQLPAVDGSLVTSLNAANIASGTLADARLSTNVALLNANNNFTGTTLQHNGNDICDASNNCNFESTTGSDFIQNQNSAAQTGANFWIDGTGTADELDANTIKQNGHDVCDTSGNCPTGGNVSTSGSPTSGAIALFTSGNTISNSILSQSGSVVTVAGTLTATDLQGDGSGITNVDAATLQGHAASYFTNAGNISSGTLADGRLSANVTLQGNAFNGNTQLVQTTAGGALPALSGTNLTNLNATSISSGTLAVARGGTGIGTAPTTGQLLIGTSTGGYQLGTLTAGDGINISNGSGSISVAVDSTVCRTSGNCAGAGSGGGVTDGGSTNYLTKTDAGGNLVSSLVYDNGSHVGIGTATPGALLDVQGGSGIVGQFSGRVVGADAVNNNEFVTLGQLNAATGGASVNSLNTLTGALNIQGTTDQVTVSSNGTDTLTLGLPQSIAATSSVTFGGLTLNGAASITGNLTVATTDLVVNSTTAEVGIGTAPSYKLDVAGNINTSGMYLVGGTQISSSNLQDGTNLAKLSANNSFTGNNTFQDTTDSATAFQIKNHLGTNTVFDADTSHGRIGINLTNPAYALDVNGDINSNTEVRVGGVAVCTITTCASSTGSGNYIQNGTSTQTGANFNIQSVSDSSATAVLMGHSATQTADILDLQSWNGTSATNLATFGATGSVKFKTLSGNDSATAFQVQSSGSADALDVDTSHTRVGIGLNNPGYSLDVVGDVNTSTEYDIAGTAICTSSGCTPTGGSNSYIQNGTGQQTSANFNIDGTGTAAQGFVTSAGSDALDTSASGTLNIGTTHATTIGIGTNAAAHTIGIGNPASGTTAQAVTVGSATNGSSTLALQGGTGSSAISLQTGNNGTTAGGIQIGNTSGAFAQTVSIGTNATSGATNTINIGNTGTGTTSNVVIGATSAATGGATTIQSKGTLNLGNGASSSIAVNTTGALSLTGGAASTWTIGSNALTITSSNLNLSSGAATLGSSSIAGSLVLQDGAGHTVTFATGTPGHNVSLSLPAGVGSTDTFCLVSLANCSGGGNVSTSGTITTGSIAYFNGSTTVASSIMSQSGTTISVAGNENVTSGNGYQIAGSTVLNAGTLSFTAASAASVQSASGQALNLTGAAASTWSVGANTLAITSSNFKVSSAGVVTVAGGQTNDITTAGATALTINPGGAAALNLGTANATSVNVGSTTASTVGIQDASGGTISIGTSAASSITIGNTGNGSSNTITVGQSTGSSTIDIGNANPTTTNVQTINIGAGATSSAGDSITIGSTSTNSGVTINGGSTTTGVSINTSGSGAVKIGNTSSTTTVEGSTISVGTGAVAHTITVGSTSGASSLTLQSGTGALNIQTQGTGGVNIATNAVAQTVTVGNTTGASTVNIKAGSGGINLNNTTTVASNISFTADGSATFQDASASATAFIVKDGATAALTVDTSNNRVIIGKGATGGAGDVLVLDSNSSAPSVINGGMYYNSNTDGFDCGDNSRWMGCDGLISTQTTQADWIDGLTSHGFITNFDQGQYTIPAGDCQQGVAYRMTGGGNINDLSGWGLDMYLMDGSTRIAGPEGNAGGGTDPRIAPASTSYQNEGWYFDITMTCYSSSTVFINGTVTFDDGAGASQTAMITSSFAAGTGESWSGGSSQTLSIGLYWNSTAPGTGDNTARLDQFVVQRLAK